MENSPTCAPRADHKRAPDVPVSFAARHGGQLSRHRRMQPGHIGQRKFSVPSPWGCVGLPAVQLHPTKQQRSAASYTTGKPPGRDTPAGTRAQTALKKWLREPGPQKPGGVTEIETWVVNSLSCDQIKKATALHYGLLGPSAIGAALP